MVQSVNEQGFKLKGWFKPVVTEIGVTQDSLSLHVCYLMPSTPLTKKQQKIKYHEGLLHQQNLTVYKVT